MADTKMMQNELNGRFAEEELGGVRVAEIGAEDTNAITVALQFLAKNGREMEKKCAVEGYLSSDADGKVLEAASSTLSITQGTDGQVISRSPDNELGETTFLVISEDDGDADVKITQTSGADTHYLNIILPDGSIFTSDAITFAA